MGLFRSRAKKHREKAAAEHSQGQTSAVTVPAPGGRREMTAEERPNPDQPGWGRTIGQQIGKARDGRASPD